MKRKNFRIITLYFQEDFYSTLDEFLKILQKEKKAGKMGTRRDNRLLSKGVRMLINKFVVEKLRAENETVEIEDKEEDQSAYQIPNQSFMEE